MKMASLLAAAPASPHDKNLAFLSNHYLFSKYTMTYCIYIHTCIQYIQYILYS